MDELGGVSDLVGLSPALTALTAGVLGMMVVATLLRAARLALKPTPVARRRWRSIGSWWVLLGLGLVMMVVGRWAVLAVMALAAALATRESLRLARRTNGSIGSALLPALSGPAFAVAVVWLPPSGRPEDGIAAVVLLLVLTELNDIAQAWWGRTLGAHAMAPVLSPNKTWEGLAGGVATTTATAALIAPPLLELGPARSAALGLMVALAGAVGDLAASRVKRAAGVDDSGTVLPGQGGMLDRVDSLAVSAPVFFVLLWGFALTPAGV